MQAPFFLSVSVFMRGLAEAEVNPRDPMMCLSRGTCLTESAAAVGLVDGSHHLFAQIVALHKETMEKTPWGCRHIRVGLSLLILASSS